jgi:hypothetical protein
VKNAHPLCPSTAAKATHLSSLDIVAAEGWLYNHLPPHPDPDSLTGLKSLPLPPPFAILGHNDGVSSPTVTSAQPPAPYLIPLPFKPRGASTVTATTRPRPPPPPSSSMQDSRLHPTLPPLSWGSAYCQVRVSEIAPFVNGVAFELRLPPLRGLQMVRALSGTVCILTFSDAATAKEAIGAIRAALQAGSAAFSFSPFRSSNRAISCRICRRSSRSALRRIDRLFTRLSRSAQQLPPPPPSQTFLSSPQNAPQTATEETQNSVYFKLTNLPLNATSANVSALFDKARVRPSWIDLKHKVGTNRKYAFGHLRSAADFVAASEVLWGALFCDARVWLNRRPPDLKSSSHPFVLVSNIPLTADEAYITDVVWKAGCGGYETKFDRDGRTGGTTLKVWFRVETKELAKMAARRLQGTVGDQSRLTAVWLPATSVGANGVPSETTFPPLPFPSQNFHPFPPSLAKAPSAAPPPSAPIAPRALMVNVLPPASASTLPKRPLPPPFRPPPPAPPQCATPVTRRPSLPFNSVVAPHSPSHVASQPAASTFPRRTSTPAEVLDLTLDSDADAEPDVAAPAPPTAFPSVLFKNDVKAERYSSCETSKPTSKASSSDDASLQRARGGKRKSGEMGGVVMKEEESRNVVAKKEE